MGCGCGKNKNKNKQSSRMPGKPLKKIGNISIPENMTPNQRRSTIAKINNDKKSIKNKHPREIKRRMQERLFRNRNSGGGMSSPPSGSGY